MLRTWWAAAGVALLPWLACHGEEAGGCEIAVAALNLPDDSDGLLHWRVGDDATVPLQLSTRYFSERLEVPVGTIGFYREAVPEALPEPPDPLVALTIPAELKLAFVVLWTAGSEDGGVEWRAKLLRGSDWKDGSMRLVNATDETLGIEAGAKRIRLTGGGSTDFLARDWEDAFPVKIHRLQPEMREVFSSKWRVAAGRREICFIADRGDSLFFRSLIDLAVPPDEPEP